MKTKHPLHFALALVLALAFAAPIFCQAAATDTLGSVVAGQKFTLSVTVQSGTLPLVYQWWKDTKPIAGATSTTLVIAAATAADAGTYAVHVTNQAGAADSNNAVITVTPAAIPPVITPISFTKG